MPSCRVCLEENATIALPCSCTGNVGTLHSNCFHDWWCFVTATSDPPACDVCRTELPTLEFYELLLWIIHLIVTFFAGFLVVVLPHVDPTWQHILWVASNLGCVGLLLGVHFRVGQRVVLLRPTV